MSDSMLNQPQFQDADKAREYLEAQVWPNGPICPHCGVIGAHYKLEGETTRPGLYKCKDCYQPFTVTVGSVFERSKIPLNKWLLAVYLLCSSKKGMSSHQLHRTLGVTYKTAWFMSHRIREAFNMPFDGPMGNGGPVEADETVYRRKWKPTTGKGKSQRIFSLVERNGITRSFHVANVKANTLKPILMKQVAKSAKLYTDSAGQYKKLKPEFPKHDSVNHLMGEYARGNVHTNTVESYFGLLKRGLVGTYHHVSEAHLQRYCTEFDFRFSHRKTTDAERADAALKQIRGKRLTYRRINAPEA